MGVEGSDFRPRGKRPGPHYEKRLRAASVKTAPPGRHTDGGGLFLEVDPSGARRWLLRIVIKGRRRDLGLGSASLVSLADARAKAQEFRTVARAGGDPTRVRDAAPKSIPFRTVAAEVHRTHIESTSRNGKHVDQWLNTLATGPTTASRRGSSSRAGASTMIPCALTRASVTSRPRRPPYRGQMPRPQPWPQSPPCIRFDPGQLMGAGPDVLREHEAGGTTEEVCRRYGTSLQTFYRKAKCGGLEVSDAQKLGEVGG